MSLTRAALAALMFLVAAEVATGSGAGLAGAGKLAERRAIAGRVH